MFCAVSRQIASTLYSRSMISRIRTTSASASESALASPGTRAFSQICRADVRPMPVMYVSAMSMRLFLGRSMPAMRAMPFSFP